MESMRGRPPSDTSDHGPSEGQGELTRKTALGIFRLLREFAEHSSRPVLDVDRYDDALWWHTLPRTPACYCRGRAGTEERAPETWLEVRKEAEPHCPKPPAGCLPWLAQEFPFSDEAPPGLLARIPDPSAAPDEPFEPQDQAFLYLEKHRKVDRQWASYLEGPWQQWAQVHRKWRAHHQVYATLFRMRQALQREGERFETVLAFGLFQGRRPDGQTVRRHLITFSVNIDFDADHGVFTVAPPPEGASPTLEIDMLAEAQRPSTEALEAAHEAQEAFAEDPWSREASAALFRTLAYSIHHRGEYLPSEEPSGYTPDHPVVALAPALIFRRRTSRSMVETLRRILDQLAGDGEIPPAIELLAAEGPLPGGSGEASAGQPPTILFPKPANDEQRLIVHRLEGSRGVLVQGPPGTGKSHTIANLVSHLLAHGKRVLVTAQTSRALRVLHDKIPEPIRALCVSALGNDRASLDALQSSVQEITSRKSSWNEREASSRIQELEGLLRKSAEEMAELDRGLRQLREAETTPKEVAGGAYRGTPQRIAALVTEEAERFAWFEDVPADPEDHLELAVGDVLELLELLRGLPGERRVELKQVFPAPEDLPSADAAAALVEAEQAAEADLRAAENGGGREDVLAVLSGIPDDLADELLAAVTQLQEKMTSARNRPLPWVARGVDDILAGDDTPWRELRQQTEELLSGMSDDAHLADRDALDAPRDISLQTLLADAEDLHERLARGKRVSFISRRLDPVIRRTAYLTESVRIGGRLCETSTALRRLIQHLRFEDRLATLWKHWEQWSQRPDSGSYTWQIGRLTENLEALDETLAVYPALEEAKALVARVPGLPQPAWHDEAAFQGLLSACRARVAERRLAEARARLTEIEHGLNEILEHPNRHDVTVEILEAIRQRDPERLLEARRALHELHEDAARLERCENGLERLAVTLPRLAAKLGSEPENPAWDERLRTLPAAWRWACARLWLEQLRMPGRLERLNRRHLELRRRRLEFTEELAALLAWREFFRRLTDDHHRHLAAWQQAVRRLRKGTGRHAPMHRRDAQEHLQHCHDAIPAWIMPIHQIYDSIAPEPAMFDVVIADEASQCGLDSLFLLYLGRQIVIVGDDEQISPTVMRFKHDEFRSMVRRHLAGFPLFSVFQPDTSLFDLGRTWFGPSLVQLREHFRCMPEIIRFSDSICYGGRLVPLRQYPPDRLEPLKAVHVSHGFRKGKGAHVLNLPEADAVVDSVVQCCQDPAYRGKTMGVISLLGSAQAAFIEGRLLERLDPNEIERRRLLCGDAYSFQGDERDVMFLSMVTAPVGEEGQPARHKARTSREAKQRFNVAASRARDQMWLVHTATLDDLGNPEDLNRGLLQHFLSQGGAGDVEGVPDLEELKRTAASSRAREGAPPRPFESWFEVDVYLKIRGRGYRTIPQFEAGRYRIDIVVQDAERRLAVECDGDAWHGADRFQADLDRQRQLERAGWTFWRVRGSEFYADWDRALESLWETLAELGIRPFPQANTQAAGDPDAPPPTAAVPPPRSKSTPSTDQEAVPISPPAPGERPPATLEDLRPVTSQPASPALHLTPGPPPTPMPAPLPLSPPQTPPEPERLSPVAKTLGASPYANYGGEALSDPHDASGRDLQDGLVAIVEAEGPIVHSRLIRVYARHAGFQRAGRQIREALKRPLAAAVRQRRLLKEWQWITHTRQVDVYSTPTQNRAPLRTAGDRPLHEIPPSEIQAVMRALRGKHATRPVHDLEAFLRRILGFYGMRRLTSSARQYLEFLYRQLVNH